TGDPPYPPRAEGPPPPGCVVHLRRSTRGREDSTRPRARAIPRRGGRRPQPARPARVRCAGHRLPAVEASPGLRRLRRVRAAHREGTPPAVLRGAVGRGGEGTRGYLQLAAADPGGRKTH